MYLGIRKGIDTMSTEWHEGQCSGCGKDKEVREFSVYGMLCSECFFGLARQPSGATKKCHEACMKAEMKKQSKKRILVRVTTVSLLAIAMTWLLNQVVWGISAGLFAASTTMANEEFRQKVTDFLTKHGVDPKASSFDSRSWFASLPDKDKEEWIQLGRDLLGKTNWLPVTLFVSTVVFGSVSFLSGWFARSWLFVGVIPLLSFLGGNPVVRFRAVHHLSRAEILSVVLAQFLISYLLAYCGVRASKKWGHLRKSDPRLIQ
jgi:hypothetical protein